MYVRLVGVILSLPQFRPRWCDKYCNESLIDYSRRIQRWLNVTMVDKLVLEIQMIINSCRGYSWYWNLIFAQNININNWLLLLVQECKKSIYSWKYRKRIKRNSHRHILSHDLWYNTLIHFTNGRILNSWQPKKA